MLMMETEVHLKAIRNRENVNSALMGVSLMPCAQMKPYMCCDQELERLAFVEGYVHEQCISYGSKAAIQYLTSIKFLIALDKWTCWNIESSGSYIVSLKGQFLL